MKKALILLLSAIIVANKIYADTEWIDVTDTYITNPDYSGNSNSGWTISASAGSTNCNYACQEFWYGTWNCYQTLTNLTAGHYRLSVSGFHRPGAYSQNDVNAEITSLIYAGTTTQPLASIYSESLSSNYNWGCVGDFYTSTYYPNTMETAAYCFEQGMYANQMEFDTDGGSLPIGIINETSIASNWTIFTGWKLEYYGEVISVTAITMSSTKSLAVGETAQLAVSILPTDATVQKLSWASSKESVATVDSEGNVTGVATGIATITATATDGSGVKATCRVTVTKNTTGLTSLVINEVQSANVDQNLDPSFNYGGWIELYNPTTTSVTLTGCYISNDASDLTKVHLTEAMAVPAKGYHVLWFDHFDQYTPTQVNFKLDMDGGTIYLSDSDGTLLTSLEYPEGISRCSYARTTNGGDEWSWTSTPTPEATNEGSTWCTERLSAPEVDQDSQIFGTSLTVCVSIPEGATLRYTTDGSTPTASNGETSLTGLFYPTATTVYRVALVEDGKMPSPVVSRTYIYKDKEFALPVIAIASANENFYGDDYGIFTQGNGNGRAGNGQASACNWNMDWERPASFDYINTEGEMCISQETAIERCGGWSRAWLPYSFKIKANKQYELQNYLPYQFFSAKPYLKHKTLQIRNGGNDNTCRIKDAALQTIIARSGIDVNTQAYQPVMHYINGKYAGTINMREPNNKHYVYANYGLDDEEIDQFEMSPDSGYVQKCGTYESMQRWYDLSASCEDDEVYEEIRQMVDIDEYCNYMAIEFYLGGTDWPQNNVKGWKPIEDGGKFRFVLFDLDGTFATTSPFTTFANKNTYTFDRLYGQSVTYITKEIELVTIFLNMLQNDSFRKQFIDTYCLVAGSVFEPSRCSEIINELANAVSSSQSIYNEVYSTSSTPWSTANTLINNLSSSRQTTMISSLKSYSKFGLTSTTAQDITLSANIDEARLFVNDLPVPTNTFSGKLFAPIVFKAQAPAGYKFAGWKKVSGTSSVDTTLIDEGDEWNYYDGGSLDSEDWTGTGFTNWKTGTAPIGYGKSVVSTTTTGYLPTYYLQKTITLDSAPNSTDEFSLSWTADDGFILYVNGEEALRYNMPSGTVTYSTYASTYAPNNPDTGTSTLDASLFKKGDNIIALELHNNSASSSDILWDASLTQGVTTTEGSYVSTDEEYTMPTSGSMTLQAVYEEMDDDELEDAGLSLTPIVINEVSAANSIYVNELFKKDDWVELYNTTDEDIDLAGMYLTDNSKKPTKWAIEGTNTIIKAHGYKVIWCSKRDAVSELHAPFKLDNEDGAMVRIMAADGSWADSLAYCAMNGDQTVGRYPDGGTDIYLMTTTSIASTNVMTTYATEWVYVAPEPEEDDTTEDDTNSEDTNGILASRSGGMSLIATNDYLAIKSEESQDVTLCVYTPSGITAMSLPLNMEARHVRVSIAHLPAGIYIARLTDEDGNHCATKFVKK